MNGECETAAVASLSSSLTSDSAQGPPLCTKMMLLPEMCPVIEVMWPSIQLRLMLGFICRLTSVLVTSPESTSKYAKSTSSTSEELHDTAITACWSSKWSRKVFVGLLVLYCPPCASMASIVYSPMLFSSFNGITMQNCAVRYVCQ